MQKVLVNEKPQREEKRPLIKEDIDKESFIFENKKQKEIKKNEFRKNKSNGHPAHIYARIGNSYKFIGITHSKITSGVENIELDKNPNPKDKKQHLLNHIMKKKKPTISKRNMLVGNFLLLIK